MKKGLICKRLVVILALVAIVCVSCEKVTDITLNKSELFLVSNETETLIATIYPDDASNKKITWKSDNHTVATVNEEGLVTAVNKGETIITATTENGKKTATCFVNIDYRNKWIGTYKFEEVFTYGNLMGFDSIGQEIWRSGRDTTFYLGSIMKSSSYFNRILVDWGIGTITTINGVTFTQKSDITVDTDGKLTYPEYGGVSRFYFYNTSYSYISGDTIRFGISASSNGASRVWEVLGLKIKIK